MTISNKEKFVSSSPVRPMVGLAGSQTYCLSTDGQLTANTRAVEERVERLAKSSPPTGKDSLKYVPMIDCAQLS